MLEVVFGLGGSLSVVYSGYQGGFCVLVGLETWSVGPRGIFWWISCGLGLRMLDAYRGFCLFRERVCLYLLTTLSLLCLGVPSHSRS